MSNYLEEVKSQRLNQMEQNMNAMYGSFNGQNYNSAPFQNFQMQPVQKKNPNVIYSLVRGYEQAQNFMLMPGEVGLLFEADKNEFYKKRIDEMGITQIQKYEYREVQNPSPDAPGIANPDAALNKRMESIENALNALLSQQNKKAEDQGKKKQNTLFDGEEIKK